MSDKIVYKKTKVSLNQIFSTNQLIHLLLPTVFLLGSFSLCANELKSNEVLSFSDAINKTLQQHPELKAFNYRLDAQQGKIQQAALSPKPELDFSLEDVMGNGGFSGIQSAQSTLSISWVLDNRLKAKRVKLVSLGDQLIMSEQEIKRLDLASKTARLYVKALAQQRFIQIANRSIEFSNTSVKEISKRVKAGKTPQAELFRAEAQLAKQKYILFELQHHLEVFFRNLAAQWGETAVSFLTLTGELLTESTPLSFSSLKTQLKNNPNLKQYLSKERIYEAQLQLSKAENKPLWKFRTGLRQHQVSDDVSLLAAVSIPIGSEKRNQGKVAEIRANISRNQAEADALSLSLMTSLFELYHQVRHNIQLSKTLQTEIIPKLMKAQKETYRAYILGKYSYMELRNVQDDLIDAQIALVEANLNMRLKTIEIERLTGAQLLTNSNE